MPLSKTKIALAISALFVSFLAVFFGGWVTRGVSIRRRLAAGENPQKVLGLGEPEKKTGTA